MRLILLLLLLSTSIPGCAPFPEIDAMGPDTGPPPQLLPIDDLLAQAGPQTEDPGPAVLARAAGLRARASAITAAPTAP
ncbi:hypothetical protein [Tabrizicola sp.]|uniref:hypothetical protein n=1 Tax=Tabrizicola sp. TaxID=2005166 RepID=UPI002736E0DE|nr:hypothetical protein [Tabrizicola sp.]MDP3194983.1 hypothetical protein [Tabrizicola sp.]